jgi:RNA polymerase sigma-70 factor (ECF subfamily)
VSKPEDARYEAFFREQFPKVARTAALVMGDVHEGMDVAQDALARAYQHWRKVSAMDRPDAWVHRVATNLALSRLRRRRRRERAIPSPPSVEPPDPTNADLFEAVRSLPPAQRSVIALRFYLDWSVDDVADALGKKPGTVRALTHQGMERLRALLMEEAP